MGKDLLKRLGTEYNKFSAVRSGDFVGKELKGVFFSNLPSVVARFGVVFNDGNLSNVSVTVIIYDKDGNETIVRKDTASRFYIVYDKPLFLGVGEYIGIKTQGLGKGNPPGGRVEIVAKTV